MIYGLKPEQAAASEHLQNNDNVLLVAPTGAGKTLTILDAAQMRCDIKRLLVLCPAKVVNSWNKEIEKWGFTNFEIVVASYDSAVTKEKELSFDGIVFDEFTRMGQAGSATVRRLRRNAKGIKWRVGATATPVSETLEKLYAYSLMLGVPVYGTRKDAFMNRYFVSLDFKGYRVEARGDRKNELIGKLKPYVYLMEQEKQVAEVRRHFVDMPDELVRMVNRVTVTGSADDAIAVANSAVALAKRLQLCQGLDVSAGEIVDGFRFDAAGLMIDEVIGGGDSLIVGYQYVLCRDEFKRRYPDADFIDGSTKAGEFNRIMDSWRAGDGRLLFLQVQAGSHGLDGLQFSARRVLMFAPIYSNDKTIQIEGRVNRTGQTGRVIIDKLLVNNPAEMRVEQMIVDKKAHEVVFNKNIRGN